MGTRCIAEVQRRIRKDIREKNLGTTIINILTVEWIESMVVFADTVNRHTNVRGMSAIRGLQGALMEGGEDNDGFRLGDGTVPKQVSVCGTPIGNEQISNPHPQVE